MVSKYQEGHMEKDQVNISQSQSKKKENESAIYAYIVPSLFALVIVCGIAVIIVSIYKGK